MKWLCKTSSTKEPLKLYKLIVLQNANLFNREIKEQLLC